MLARFPSVLRDKTAGGFEQHQQSSDRTAGGG
jgi:hypothetical protein